MPTTTVAAETVVEIADIDVTVYIPKVTGVTKSNLRDIEKLIIKALKDAGYSAEVEADMEAVDNSWPGEGAPGSCRCGSPTCTGRCPDCGMHETPLHGHNVHYDA